MSTADNDHSSSTLTLGRALLGDGVVDDLAGAEKSSVETPTFAVRAEGTTPVASPDTAEPLVKPARRAPRSPGRDPEPAIQRLLVLLQLLALEPGSSVGVDRLVQAGGYTGSDAVRKSGLSRDLNRLRAAGWSIDNIAPRNEKARYLLRRDNLHHGLLLTPGERAALDEAFRDEAVLASDLPPHVSDLSFAARHACVVRFSYGGSARVVDPVRLQCDHGGWRLRGRDQGDGVLKWFALQRISWIDVDEPRTAEPVEDDEAGGSLNPLAWRLDPPVDVRLATTPEHIPLIESKLGAVRVIEALEEELCVETRVTNRAALTAALLELGTRVRLVGPRDVKDVFFAGLEAMT